MKFSFWKSTGKGEDTATPTVASGSEVYDKIMSEIEPDLMSDRINKLEELYAHENEQDKAQRMERYKAAFLKYLKVYEEYQAQQSAAIKQYGRKLVTDIEKESDDAENTHLEDLESAIAKL